MFFTLKDSMSSASKRLTIYAKFKKVYFTDY